jgi:hypothetical protein
MLFVIQINLEAQDTRGVRCTRVNGKSKSQTKDHLSAPGQKPYEDRVAEQVIELISETTTDPEDLLLNEAKRLNRKDVKRIIRQDLEEILGDYPSEVRALKFRELQKQIEMELTPVKQQELRAQLRADRQLRKRKCPFFLCVFFRSCCN